jgi:hypothetical protein
MRRILLSCAILGLLALLPAAASARAQAGARPGYLVVQNAAGDGGVNGRPVVTLVVRGFVLGSVKQQDEARIDVYQLPSRGGQGAPQGAGAGDWSRKAVRWRTLSGTEFYGNGYRFRAMGGFYRVVVRGSGVYLFAGGRNGSVTFRGSSSNPYSDGKYSIDGGRFRSLPVHLTRRLGRG